MNNFLPRTVPLALVLALCTPSFGQGNNMFQSTGAGDQYLAPSPPLFPFAPRSVNIGTLPVGLAATLRVRGDQLPVNDAFGTFTGAGSACTFRTDVQDSVNQNWSMVRNGMQIGRLWHYGTQNAFNVQSMVGPLRLRNADMDGIRINGNNNTTVNGYTDRLRGYVAVGDGSIMDSLSPNTPWARLHLVHDRMGSSVPYGGFRPWMRNGLMGMGNNDLFFIGHKYYMGTSGTGNEVSDSTDLVAAWYDDVLPAGGSHRRDNLSFRFVGDPGVGGSAGAIEGLEILRLRPYRAAATDPIQGFVGIGDWANSSGFLPEERLDILDRTARIRQLPTTTYQAPTTDDDKVVVVRSDGRLNWCDASILTGAADCDWSVSPGATANHMYAAQGAAGTANCPDITETVNIGTTAIAAKLHLRNDPAQTGLGYGAIFSNNTYPAPTATSGDQIGISVNNTGISGYENYAGHFRAYGGGGTASTGVQAGVWSYAECSTAAANVCGVLSSATETTGAATSNIFGLSGSATARTGNPTVYGLWVDAIRNTSGSSYTTPLYGVYARVRDDLPASETYESHEWAGYFKGHVHVDGDLTVNGTYPTSDDALKINESPLMGAMDLIAQLQPMSYEFDHDAFGFMHLPTGPQAGLIAQQAEGPFPALVKEFVYPAEFDSSGVMEHPEVQYKALNYTGLIPYLVAGIQQQQAMLEQLQTQLNACCASTDGGIRQGDPGAIDPQSTLDQRLLIHPNPFTHTTTIALALDRTSRVSMTVMGLNGHVVRTLDLGQAEPGIFTYVWDSGELAAGQYVLTILLDGKAETATVVKLADR